MRPAAILLVASVFGAAGCASGLRLEAAGGRAYAPAEFRDRDLAAAIELAQVSHQIGTALSLELRNRSAAPIELHFSELVLVGADHRMVPLSRAGDETRVRDETLAPGAHVEVRLPAAGGPALALRSGDAVDLVLPTTVRGVRREYHFRLRVRRGARPYY